MSAAAHWSTELFGTTLVQSSGSEVKTADVLSSSTIKAIGIYFSAHWCPPCRGFTPKLAEFYKGDLKAKGFEIVFVSSDKDEAAFKDYFNEMPWLALPYAGEGRKLKETLSKKFKVSGIPSLVILDAKTGEIITKDGRSAVMEDPKGEEFPWIPKPLSEVLASTDYLAHDCEVKVGAEESHYKSATTKTLKYADAFAGKKLGIYFSAHWCPPCRNFTPLLKKTYEKLVAEKGEKFDILFCSADKSEEQFTDYFGSMPWKALPFNDAGKKVEKQLSKHFDVNGIPCLVILDEERQVISKSAVGKVRADPEGANFPWAPELVNDIDADPEGINDHPCVILFTDGMESGKQTEWKEKILKPCAEWCVAQSKTHADAKVKETMGEYVFLTASAKEGRLSQQIRADCDLGEASSDKPQAIVVDVQDGMAFFNVPDDKLASAEKLQEFLTEFANGTKPEKKTIKP